MIVLDTHAWVWWLTEPRSLSRKARAATEQASEHATLAVSSISVWEVALLSKRDRIELEMPFQEWLHKAEAVAGIEYVEIDNRIAFRSVELPGFPNPDPADRIVVSTALELGAPVVSKNAAIRSYAAVESIW